MRLGFVVLHYISLSDTISCIESIRSKNHGTDYMIVIVDNGSPDNSVWELEKLFIDSDDVRLIHNKENLGFAGGNNVGIRYMNSSYSPDYIVVLNSDIILLDEGLLDTLSEEYEREPFAVLGPMVCLPNGLCNCNPMKEKLDYRDIVKYKHELRRERRFLDFHMYSIYKIMKKFEYKKNLRKTKVKNISVAYLEHKKNVVLHGCCLVFSKKYFEVFEGFDESTFLYFEEDLLYVHCMENGLPTVYCPRIKVLHNQGASTQAKNRNETKRMKWVVNHCLNSVLELERVYCKYKSSGK